MTTHNSTIDLIASAARVLEAGQAPTGAFIASPNFPEYRFAWLRDGSFCALAMDALDDTASARAFHQWVTDVVLSNESQITTVVSALREGRSPSKSQYLPTRYTLDGQLESAASGASNPAESWPNFQLDGYGTWIFSLYSHFEGQALPKEFERAVELVVHYLEATWELPCYDYWEEFGDRRHTSTLAAIAAGLRAGSRLLDRSGPDVVADHIMQFIRSNCSQDGHFTKGPEDARVDASLVSLCVPFALVGRSDPMMVKTIEKIRADLSSASGGVRRYVGDTYYGGNPWILLTAWLGWYDKLTGRTPEYERAKEWIIAASAESGDLAEQVVHEPQSLDHVQQWIDRWGPVADPLLWSHAKYVLMEKGSPAVSWY